MALEGDPAPGILGTFSQFIGLALNDSGEVVFQAETINGTSKRQGIFLFANGQITPIELEGEEAPGGGTFADFRGSRINNAGDVAFIAKTSRSQSIFLFSRGEVSRVADFPGSGYSISFNDSGAIAFSAGLVPPNIYLISDGDIIEIGPSSDSPSLNNRGDVAFVSQSVTATGSIYSREVLLYSKGKSSAVASASAPRESSMSADLNDSGDVVFLDVVVSENFQISLFKNGIVSTIVPRTRTALSRPVVNNSGLIAFGEERQVRGLAIYSRIVLVDGTDFVRIDGGKALGTFSGEFSAFGEPSLNNLGVVGFVGYVRGGNASSGIFLATPRTARSRDKEPVLDPVQAKESLVVLS